MSERALHTDGLFSTEVISKDIFTTSSLDLLNWIHRLLQVEGINDFQYLAMFYVLFDNVLCSFINLINLKYTFQ